MLQRLRHLYQTITQYTYLLIWFVIGPLFLVTIYIRAKIIFLVNPDIGGIESNVIYSVLRVLAGYPLYQNPEQAPYAITQYSPVYYYLTVGVSQLMGFTADDVYEVYGVGRCVSLVANCLYGWGIIQLARRFRLPTSVALLAGLLAFVLLPPQSYGRPDSLYNALVIWTIWAVLRWNSSGVQSTAYGAALPALFTAVTLFSKQSALCLPIIISGYLVFTSNHPRQLFLFLGWLIVWLSILYVSFFHQDPALIYINIVRGISNGIDLANFRHNLIDHYLRPFAWLVIPALAISIRYIGFESGARQLVGLATLGLFLFALATGLKWGSALNYFTEFTGLSCLLVADALWALRKIRSDWVDVGRLGLVLGVVWVVPVNAMNFNWNRTFGTPVDMTQYWQEQAIAQYVKEEIGQHPDWLVYSTLYNSSYLNAFLIQNCIVPQQDLILGSAYPLRSFNYDDLDRAARDGRIQFVISRNEESEVPLSPPIHLANYHPVKLVGGYTIYQFKAPTGQLSPAFSTKEKNPVEPSTSPSPE